MVGEPRGDRGCVHEGRRSGEGIGVVVVVVVVGGGVLSNLGIHFGVWKTVGLFQLECNISSEHAPAL